MKLTDYLTIFSVLSQSGWASTAEYSFNPYDYKGCVRDTDVVVIGGGSSGSYAAVKFRNAGLNVVVVDQKSRLGGHAETYTDPLNNYTIDIGVIVFGNTTYVRDYFKQFDIPLIPLPLGGGGKISWFNPLTGKTVGYTPPDNAALGAALQGYSQRLAQYPNLVNGFNLSYPVASELLEPFGEWVQRHGLNALFPLIYRTNQGYVPISRIPVLYMFKYLNAIEVTSLETGFLTTKNHDIAALYNAIAKWLGSSNLLLSSRVVAMKRGENGVSVVTRHEDGTMTLVKAKKLVSAIPPLLSNLGGYDLSTREISLFRQFHANGYASAVINTTGFGPGFQSATIDTSQPLNLPAFPNTYGFTVNSGTNLTQSYWASPRPQPDNEVKQGILEALERYQEAHNVAHRGGDIVAFTNHAPFNLEVSCDAIRAGFYRRLDALNGQESTFWTGAAFQSQDSTALWEYSEKVFLPRVLASLQ